MLLSPLHEQQNTPHLLQFLLSHINSIFFYEEIYDVAYNIHSAYRTQYYHVLPFDLL